jgi:hypothetical protein
LVAALARVVCPKCGKPGSLERYTSAGRTYLRVRHSEGGRRRFCYLGAEKPVYGRRLEAPKLAELPPNLVEGGGSEPPNLSQQPPPNSAGYEDALEIIHTRFARARERAAQGDLSELAEFVVWVERRLSPLIAKCYEEAKVLLQARGEDK